MDAIAHTQVSVVCLVTLAVLLRAQQKMRDKSLPGRLFTALLWSAGAPQQGRTCGDREPASGRTSWRDGKNMPICIIFVRPKFIR